MSITRQATIVGNVTLEVEIVCHECLLTLEWEERNFGSSEVIYIKPCANCEELKNLKI